ncbi:MAG: class I SAM-dependent methyltransferase [Acidobacteriia bacterium]|nr:class I SAM-dependent methyltransferase [Terriglobia bacterium]
MIGFIKAILPLPIRDRLRPGYRKVEQRIKLSGFWPNPSSWQQKKRILAQVECLKDFYQFASDEFEIIQNEPEIVGLLEFLREKQPRVVGEIGMKSGGNSFLFMQALPSVETMISMDLQLPLENVRKLKYLARPRQNMTFVQGDSSAPQTIARVRTLLAKRQFDFLFIDGDHSYEGVKRDFLNYRSMVRPGGLDCLS